MKTYIKGIYLLLAFFTSIVVSAQQDEVITGKIIDPYNNKPVQGAIISSSVSGYSATSDSIGQFKITVPSLTGILTVAGQGYHKTSNLVNGNKNITISMVPLNKYGFASEKISAFRDENFYQTTQSVTKNQRNLQQGSNTIDNAIQGLFPGLKVINKSGMPGEGSYLSVRGVQSMLGNNAPLIILNGVPYLPDYNESPIIGGYSKNIFNAISISDIDNITLLKGGEASLYGSIGSNGVLLINTKKATDMKTMVEFTGMYGVAYNKRNLSVLKPAEFKSLIGDVGLSLYDDLGLMLEEFPFLKDDPDYYYQFLYNNNTDWQKEIYSPALVTDNTLRIKGGDAVARYDLSVSFMNQNGTLDNTGMSRYSSRLNSNIVLGKKMDFFTSVGFAFLTSKLMEQGMLEATNPILTALYKAPILSPYRKDVFNNQLPGYDIVRQFNMSNPLAVINSVSMGADMYDFTFNTGLNYNYSENLKFTGTFGLFYNYNRENAFIPGKTLHSILPLQNGSALNTARAGVGEALNYYANINSQYKKQLGKNHLSAALGYQALITRNEYDAGQGINTASDFYQTLDYVTSGENFWGYIEEWNWMNFYAHADYTFDNLLSASVNASYDAASSTGSDATRWGLFPSVGLTWYAKNMDFLKNNGAIDKLNIMAEYSKSGNSRMSARTSKYYYMGQKYRDLSGIVRGNVPNTLLKWENSTTIDLGIEITSLNNKLTAELDFYHVLSDDVILPTKISPEFGIESIFYNQGTISNQGIELALIADVFSNNDWTVTLGGNLCMNRNRLESLGSNTEIINELSDGTAIISKVGESVYSFYGYKSEGIIASQADADNLALVDYKGQQFNAGDVQFADLYGNDGIIDARDRTIIGSAEPDLFGGLFANVSYQQFSLSANFTYSLGNDMYNAVRRSMESMDNFYNQSTAVNRRWLTNGQVTDIPRATYNDPMKNNRFSDRWIENASYLRLSNITCSYNFDSKLLKFAQGGTIYLSAENLFTFTNYLGLDPVTSYSYNPMLQGFDYGKAPLPATVKFGFKLQF